MNREFGNFCFLSIDDHLSVNRGGISHAAAPIDLPAHSPTNGTKNQVHQPTKEREVLSRWHHHTCSGVNGTWWFISFSKLNTHKHFRDF
jgi:hypothetical protein